MKPCDNVIATVRFLDKSLDMELPAFLPVKELTGKLCETFCVMYPSIAGRFDITGLELDGCTIPEDKTLAAYGVWDGSYLTCTVRKEDLRHE